MNLRISIVAAVSAAALLLAGCTEEKAAALYTAAQAYKRQADDALDAFEKLIVQASLAPEVSAKDAAQIYLRTQVNAYAGAPAEAKPGWRPNVEHLRIALGDEQFRQRLEDAVAREFRATRLIHEDLAAAFALLPDAVYLSGQPVRCSEQLVAQLTRQFADNATLLSGNTVKFINRAERANTQLAAAIRNAGSEGDRQLALKALIEVLEEERRLNQDAIAKSVAAAEAGIKLQALVSDYDKVTLKDILAFAREISPLVEAFDGKGAADRLNARIDTVKARLESDARLQRLAARNLNTEQISCR